MHPGRRRRPAGGLGLGDAVTHADPASAARTCFGSVFAAGVLRVAWEADFTTASPVDDAVFVADQAEGAARYLLRG